MIIKGGAGAQNLVGTAGADTIYGYDPSGVSSVTVTPLTNAPSLSNPLFATYAPGDATGLYIVNKDGEITRYDTVSGTSNTFLNVGNISTDGERGVLGLAFHPDYDSNGRFFVFATNGGGDVEVREYERDGGSGTIVADTAVQRIILRVEHSAENNHNGGSMAFHPVNGLLYIAIGDGGMGGDESQDGSSFLGKILRIDINSTDFGGDTNRYYHVPPQNTFAAGGDGVNDAIFSMGLRNPWRISFDATGNLWIGDVGQSTYEEVNFIPGGSNGGQNFGWNVREGTGPYAGGTLGPGALTNPIHQYTHAVGQSITGGFVYDGPAPALQGKYIFGDFGSGRIFALEKNGASVKVSEITSLLSSPIGAFELASFGLDTQHNLYAIKIGGEVVKLTPQAAGADGADTISGGAGKDLIYGGAGNDTLKGDAGVDNLQGGAGNDLLNGGADPDYMNGGAGNDIYWVETTKDVVVETANNGHDRINSSITYTLKTNFETLVLNGTAVIHGTGNAAANNIYGNSANNGLNGLAGNDLLSAGAGNDVLSGGSGADTLTGGVGADSFLFNTTPGPSNIDRITDFKVADDTIRLENGVFVALGASGVLSAAAFRTGAAAGDASDRVIYNSSTGALFYDADGTGGGAQVQIATLAANLALTHQDFLII